MHSNDDTGKNKYEMTDANAKGIVVVGIVLTVIAVLSGIFGLIVTRWSTTRPAMTEYERSPLAPDHDAWPAVTRLQSDPGEELAEHFAEQDAVARSYGTVSEEPEVYRIPVDVAMDIIAHNGTFPEFKALGTEQE